MGIELYLGDITELEVDVIVNAANERMLGGGGVDGAIHRAAGPKLLSACRKVPELRPGVRCPTGQARLTPGFALKARHVVHTVGPVWQGGNNHEPELLRQCYQHSLELAASVGAVSVAFPAISCGVYRFPLERAARIQVNEVTRALKAGSSVQRVVLVAFQQQLLGVLRSALEQVEQG